VTQTGGYTEGDGDADNYTVLPAISVYLVSFYTIFYFWPYTVSHKAGKIQFGQAKLIRPKKSCVSPFRALKKCGSVGFFFVLFFPSKCGVAREEQIQNSTELINPWYLFAK
jgi:hypothetical protein